MSGFGCPRCLMFWAVVGLVAMIFIFLHVVAIWQAVQRGR